MVGHVTDQVLLGLDGSEARERLRREGTSAEKYELCMHAKIKPKIMQTADYSESSDAVGLTKIDTDFYAHLMVQARLGLVDGS